MNRFLIDEARGLEHRHIVGILQNERAVVAIERHAQHASNERAQ